MVREDFIREFDRVTISGFCTSEQKFIYNVHGVIGSVCEHEIKLWPDDLRLDGKLWFRRKWVRLIKHFGSTIYDERHQVSWLTIHRSWSRHRAGRPTFIHP